MASLKGILFKRNNSEFRLPGIGAKLPGSKKPVQMTLAGFPRQVTPQGLRTFIFWFPHLLCLLLCCVLSRVQFFATPWTIARQSPLSMGSSRQEYRTGLPFPSPGDLPDPGIEAETLLSPALSGGFLTTAPPGKPLLCTRKMKTHWSKLVYQQQALLISFLSERIWFCQVSF